MKDTNNLTIEERLSNLENMHSLAFVVILSGIVIYFLKGYK